MASSWARSSAAALPARPSATTARPTSPRVPAPAAAYSYDGANRLTSDGTRTFTFDGADRLVVRGSDTFAYDALSRLTSATVTSASPAASASALYAYDGDGLLRSRTSAGSTTGYLWDTSVGIAQLLQAGSERIVQGLGPLYRVHADGSYDVFIRDALGSVRAEVSGSRTLSNAFDYTGYGEVRASVAGPPTLLGFAGELRDPSGLIYLRARWYDPGVGRFVTADPVEGLAGSPSTLNPYGYASANPTRFRDPAGKCTDPNPGSSQVRYCVAAYISAPDVCVVRRCYQGDNRGAMSSGGTSRVEMHIGPNGFIGTPFSNATIRLDDGMTARAMPACEQLMSTYACQAANPLEEHAPPIVLTVSFADGYMWLRGTGFPSVEVWGYGGGEPRLIVDRQSSGGPFGLGALLGLSQYKVLGVANK